MPKISVIVPVYNAEQLLITCIDSILEQSFTDFELILVNDGSLDDSGNICDAYANRDQRVQVIHQKNQGASTARNIGLKMAQGEYITFIDSDDYVPKEYFEQLLVTAGGNCDLAVCPCVRPEYASKQKAEEIYIDFRIPSCEQKEQFSKLFASYVLHGPCTKLYKREIIVRHDVLFPVDIKQGEDCVFVFTYLKHCDTIHYRSRPVYYYYENGASVTHQVRKERFANGLRVNAVYLDCINQKKFMTAEIQQVWARATFKDAYHGIEDIFQGKAYSSAWDLLKQVNAIIKHPMLSQAMKIAKISGYNKKLVWLMKCRQTMLYCMIWTLSGLKRKIKK